MAARLRESDQDAYRELAASRGVIVGVLAAKIRQHPNWSADRIGAFICDRRDDEELRHLIMASARWLKSLEGAGNADPA